MAEKTDSAIKRLRNSKSDKEGTFHPVIELGILLFSLVTHQF